VPSASAAEAVGVRDLVAEDGVALMSEAFSSRTSSSSSESPRDDDLAVAERP
jgi:hypothetical protein